MKRHLINAAFLLTITTLSACNSTERPEWLGGEPKRPAADVVISGPRRLPVLQKVPIATPVPQDDYYDNESMMAPPPPPPPPPPQVMDKQAMNVAKPIRKPFAGDPHYSMETAATAPVPPPPDIPPSLEPKPAELAASSETKAAVTETEKPAEEKSSSLLSQVEDRLGDKPTPPEEEKIKDKPYPKLSDVPERPKELTAMKEDKLEKMEELTADHTAAQVQREALTAEPTQATETKTEPVKPKAKKKSAKKKQKAAASEKQVADKKPEKKTPVVEAAPAAGEDAEPKLSLPSSSAEPKMSFPPGKYEDQLKQEQTLY